MKIEKAIAVFKIKDAGKMTPKGREDIAEWMRKQADELIMDGENYSKHFIARYLIDKEV